VLSFPTPICYTEFKMRRTLIGLLATAALVSATGPTCVYADLKTVVARQCGCDNAVLKCLGPAPDLERLESIEHCYIVGGCEKAAAKAAATRLVRECKGDPGLMREDLKKRQKGTTAEEATTEERTQEKTSQEEKTTERTRQKTTEEESTAEEATTTEERTTERSTNAPSTTEATTTAESALTTEASPTPIPASTITESPTVQALSTTPATTGAPVTTGQLVCSNTSMKQTSQCSVSRGKTITCTPTQTAIATCKPENVCFKNKKNEDVCILRDNRVAPAGIAVAIVFPACIALLAIAIVVIHHRDKSARNRALAAKAITAGSGRKVQFSKDVEADGRYEQVRGSHPMQSEDNLPLMEHGAPRGDQQSYNQQQAAYFDSEQRVAPMIPPKLEALPYEGGGDGHWSKDYGNRR
jgi:hypothetical protein